MSFAKAAALTGVVGAASLCAMAQHSLVKKAKQIISFGDAPTNLIAPILPAITDPNQIRALEIDSPQILSLTPDIWKAFIQRDIPDWESKIIQPQNPASWWKVYRKLKREDDTSRLAAEEKLRESLNVQAAQRKTNSTLVLHAVLPEERESILWLDKGVKPKNAGRNALTALRQKNSQGQMTRATINRMTPTNNRAPPSSVSRPLSKIQGLVKSAPRSMIGQYARQNGVPLPPGTSTSRFTPTGGVSKLKQPRNPFRAHATGMKDIHVEALNLAMRLEAEGEAAQKAEAEVKIAAIKAKQGAERASASSHPRFPDITAAKRAGASKQALAPPPARNASPSSARGPSGSPARPPPDVVAKGNSPSAAAPKPAVAKRKGPNIFMAPKRAKKA